MDDIISTTKAAIADIEQRLQRHASVINGTPWVIECAPGFYLVADGDGYRGGSITDGVACYSLERVTVAAHHIRKEHGSVFGNARHVHIVDALNSELSDLRGLLRRAEQRQNKAA